MSGRAVDVVVVGGGMGGLAASIALASAGQRVRLYEKTSLGGKLGTAEHDGVQFDTGPSLFTLPDVLESVVRRAGRRLDDVVTLVRPRPAFRYHFDGAPALDVFVDPHDTLASVRAAFGAPAADEFALFLQHAKRTWDIARERFIFNTAPSIGKMMAMAVTAPWAVRGIDAQRTMQTAIDSMVTSPPLRRVLYRYATYNGSDHRQAPATLNCIAHVDLGLGGYGVVGGMRAVPAALAQVAARAGVDLVEGTGVDGLVLERGGVVGVRVGASVVPCRAVVVNADVGWLRQTDAAVREALPKPAPPSLSGVTAVLRARRRADRVAHQVLFSRDAAVEARQLFDEDRPPDEPTVYLCAQEKAHQTAGWPDHEPVFLMVNTPARPERRRDDDDQALLARGVARAVARGLLDADDAIVWRRTAAGLAARFPGSDGSLYGAASNDRFAAFQRPKNALKGVRGVYLASGSAHPGGGVPLCLQSGLLAADAILR